MASGTDYSRVNFFTDLGIAEDPYPYYEYLRAQCPVTHIPSSGVVAVTGYDELNEVYKDSATFSAVNSSLGPFPLPFEVTGDDISAQIEAHRDQFPMSEHLVSFDPPKAHRAPYAAQWHVHPEAAQGKRGVHVASRRSADRRVRQRRTL